MVRGAPPPAGANYLSSSGGVPLLAAGAAFAGEGLVPRTKLPDPLMWAPVPAGELIKSPKEAINVFDFEPSTRTVPARAFSALASGH